MDRDLTPRAYVLLLSLPEPPEAAQLDAIRARLDTVPDLVAGAPEAVEALGLTSRELVVAVALAVAGNYAYATVEELRHAVEAALAAGETPIACTVEDLVADETPPAAPPREPGARAPRTALPREDEAPEAGRRPSPPKGG